MAVTKDVLEQIRHIIRPHAVRLANMIARGVVQLVDDSGKLQMMQIGVLDDETIDKAEHHQPYGFTSVPKAGAELVVVFPVGDRSHPLVVSTSDRRYRPTGGQAGEVCLYTDEGDTIRLGRGHVMTLATTGTLKLGGSSAAQQAILGNQFMTALSTLVTAIGTAVSTSGTPAGATAAGAAITTALTTFQSSASAFLSAIVKLQ